MVCIFIALFQSNDSSKRCTIHATFTHTHIHTLLIMGQFGVQYLAQGHFNMGRRPALPTEPLPHVMLVCFTQTVMVPRE